MSELSWPTSRTVIALVADTASGRSDAVAQTADDVQTGASAATTNVADSARTPSREAVTASATRNADRRPLRMIFWDRCPRAGRDIHARRVTNELQTCRARGDRAPTRPTTTHGRRSGRFHGAARAVAERGRCVRRSPNGDAASMRRLASVASWRQRPARVWPGRWRSGWSAWRQQMPVGSRSRRIALARCPRRSNVSDLAFPIASRRECYSLSQTTRTP